MLRKVLLVIGKYWMGSCVALLASACTSNPVAPKGTDASSGFQIDDKIVLVSDLDLREGESGGKSSYSNSRFILLNYDRSQAFHPKSHCSIYLAANQAILSANQVLRITSRSIEAGDRLDKFGDKYKFSRVQLFAFSGGHQIKAVVICEPEEVAHFGLWRNAESSGRMMTVEEIEGLVKEYIAFPDAH